MRNNNKIWVVIHKLTREVMDFQENETCFTSFLNQENAVSYLNCNFYKLDDFDIKEITVDTN